MNKYQVVKYSHNLIWLKFLSILTVIRKISLVFGANDDKNNQVIVIDNFKSLYFRANECKLKGCSTYRNNPVSGSSIKIIKIL